MPEERTLVANLVPQIDDDDLQSFKKQLFDELSSEISIDLNPVQNQQTAPQVMTDPEIVEAMENIEETVHEEFESVHKDVIDNSISDEDLSDALGFYWDSLGETLDDLKDVVKENNEDSRNEPDYHKSFQRMLRDKMDDFKDSTVNALGTHGAQIMTGITVGFGVVRIIFDLLKKAWDLLVSSSPFLKNILNLFDQALGLILGPLGTAIGMELIPILTDMYDRIFQGVQAIWQAYEEGGLSAMIKETLHVLWDVFAPLIPELIDIGTMLVGELVKALGEVIYDWIVGSLTRWWNEKMDISDKIEHPENMATDFVDTFGTHGGYSVNPIDWFIHDIFGLDEGGMVEANPPYGSLFRIGETQREFVIPESKMSKITSTTTTNNGTTVYNVTNYVYGYTDTDLTQKIEMTMDRRIATSSLTGGL